MPTGKFSNILESCQSIPFKLYSSASKPLPSASTKIDPSALSQVSVLFPSTDKITGATGEKTSTISIGDKQVVSALATWTA